MKKVSLILAAAALAIGMNACTDDPIFPEIIEEGNVVEEGGAPTSVRVKSVADLNGTNWQYAMEDMEVADFDGNVIATIDFSNMPFTLTFDEDYAQLAFPEDMVMLTAVEDNGSYTLEEVAEMHFAYTYELSTTSGMLTAMANDITGEPIDLQIPFTYDATNDAIIIELAECMGADPDNSVNFQIVFQRAE